MRNNQIKLDVVGNNIANVNTTAYKSGRVTFQDLFSQTISNSQAPTSTSTGGINAKQVGLGMQLGSIGTNMENGSLQNTGYRYDFAVAEGNGFFVVSDQYPTDALGAPDYDAVIPEEASSLVKRYTRDGSFELDYEGNLVTASGYRVLGYLVTEDGQTNHQSMVNGDHETSAGLTTDKTKIAAADDTNEGKNMYGIRIPKEIWNPEVEDGAMVKLETFSIDGTGLISAVYGDTTYYLGKVGMATFANPAGLEKQGGNMYVNTNNSGKPDYGVAGEPGFGKIRQGFLEMSNVDLATEFTEMIITSRAYQANSRTIRTSDEMLQELINLKR